MKKALIFLEKLAAAGVIAVIIISPTQYSVEVSTKTYLSPVDPLVWGVFLLLAVCMAARHVRAQLPSLFGCAVIMLAGLSVIKAGNRLSSLKEVFQLAEYFVAAYILFAFFIDGRGRRAAAVYVFAGVGTLIVFFALVQYFRPEVAAFKVSGTFGNRNVLGGYLALLLPLMTGLMLYEKNVFRIGWYALTVAAGLLVDLSGGSMAGIIAAVSVMAMLKGWKFFAGLVVLLAALMLFAAPRLPRDNAGILADSVRLMDEDGNVSSRYVEWQAAAGMTGGNPLLGVGAGNYQANIGMHYGMLPNPTGPSEPDTQNLYVVIMSSIGLIGLAAFAGIFCRAGVQVMRQYACAGTGFDRGLAAGLFGSVLAFAVACVWSPLLVRGIGIPLVFILCLADRKQDKEG